MSDLCLYELEDNVWDEFGKSDDHIVPQPGGDYVVQFGVRGDSRKKPRCEVIGVINTSGSATKDGFKGEEKSSLTLPKRDTMLEEGSWCHTTKGVFSGSCDSVKEVKSVASDDNINSISNEFCAEDPILDGKCREVDNSLNCFPLNHSSQIDNDLSFLDNDCEDKESSELLYYGWPDIGNFEDVDRMFRSCDSTFELGSLSNDDDLGWFSSSHPTEGSEDVLKSASKLESVSEYYEDSRPDFEGPSINVSDNKSILMGDRISLREMDDDNANFNNISFSNGLDTKPGIKDDSIPSEKINLHKRQSKNQNQPELKRKDRNLENGPTFHQYGSLKQYLRVKDPFGNSSCQVFPPSCLKQQKQIVGTDSLSYMKTQVPYMNLDYCLPTDHISDSTISCTKSENNGYPSRSLKESSYVSNQVQSMESCHGPLSEAPAMTTNGRIERLYPHHDLVKKFKHETMASPMKFYDPVSAQKQVHLSVHEMEDQSEVGGSRGLPAKLNTSNAQDSSYVSSVSDEVSLDATSFHHLQQVMEQLDIRTKLCIRDSLYRLAKSAEQRHNCAFPSGGVRDDGDASGVTDEETNKCSGFIDMETDTNPIDRSIAHLLFHRPSDPSVKLTSGALPFRSPAMVHDSITSPPGMAELKVCQEDTAGSAGKKFPASDGI
ncbi:hypothetical protein CFOL_v3_35053 [Cephalotus follicularis]|uniref:Protein LNK1 n=1 Tax=Cephalotus follicularis TaxID=3775 RepID=A0A1Q3DH70_CEPFO|nr:hypothetical protein CFOL_v3_35053 [Cephalotus follicularis]